MESDSASRKQRESRVVSNSLSHQLGMGCKVPDVRFAIDDLTTSRVSCRPTAAADKIARLYLCNIVSAGRQQSSIGRDHVRQGAAQHVMVIVRGEQAGIASYEQNTDDIEVCNSGDSDVRSDRLK